MIEHLVKKMMIATDTTQKALAEAIGTTQGSFSRDIKKNDMKISKLCAIADVLGYDVDIKITKRDTEESYETRLKVD